MSYPTAVRAAASAKIAYELGYAEAIDKIRHEMTQAQAENPKAKLTVAETDAIATIRTKDQYKEYRVTEAEVSAQKMQIEVLSSILMSTQSRCKLELIEKGLGVAQI